MKKLIILCLIFLTGCTSGIASLGVVTPNNLLLKAPKERILTNIEVNDKRCYRINIGQTNEKEKCDNYGRMIKYYYASDRNVPKLKLKDLVNNLEINGLAGRGELEEDLAQRNFNYHRFHLDENTDISVFMGGIQYVKELETGIWYEYDVGTTTVSEYARQIAYVPLFERIKTWVLGKTAYATHTPFYPDPHVETSSVDGHVFRSGVDEAFSTIRTSAGNGFRDNHVTNTIRLSASGTTNQFEVLYRLIAVFDTGAEIPNDDIISNAVLSFWFKLAQDQSGESPAINITSVSPASDTELAASDYNIANWTNTDLSTDVLFSGITTGQYTDFTITDLSVISTTDKTRLGGRTTFDIDNSPPTWSSGKNDEAQIAGSETAGTDNDTKLIVTHSAVVVAVPPKQDIIWFSED